MDQTLVRKLALVVHGYEQITIIIDRITSPSSRNMQPLFCWTQQESFGRGKALAADLFDEQSQTVLFDGPKTPKHFAEFGKV